MRDSRLVPGSNNQIGVESRKQKERIRLEKQKNTKTFHKINCTQKTTTKNTISKNIKNVNHIKSNDKTTVKYCNRTQMKIMKQQ